jgi:hypothetical protein
MKRPSGLVLISLFFITMLWQCTQTYVSPYASPPTGYLVVEGYISGNGPTQYKLSRTVPLPGTSGIPVESSANVQVEGSDNSVYPLTEQGAGTYVIDTLSLNVSTQYRLRITTAGGEKYLSEFVVYKPTPPMDSVNWVYGSQGVNIYTNTHDPANATRYYQWDYKETWEYHSAEASEFEYDGDTTPVMVLLRPQADQIFTCWHTDSSTTIILGSTAKLAQDEIHEQPLVLLPANGQQLSVLYSILVRQFALTDSGYIFLSMMQKNTESLGSIFDAQPSQIKGNIQCLTNPDVPVIGYISAGTVQQQRIFISRSQLPAWDYEFSCENPDTTVANDPKALQDFFFGYAYIPVTAVFFNGRLVGYASNQSTCVDCRTMGGTTQEPSFWPQ